MILRKLQVFVLWLSLVTLGVLSESSLLTGNSQLSGNEASYSSILEGEIDNNVETSKNSPDTLRHSDPLEKSADGKSSKEGGVDSSMSPLLSTEYEPYPGTDDVSASPLIQNSEPGAGSESSIQEPECSSKYSSPKNQEESLMLLNDPNYTVDDALALLERQRKIHDSVKGLNRQASEQLETEYVPDKTVSPSSIEYDSSVSLAGIVDQSIPTSQEAVIEDEDPSLFPKELSPPKELEKEASSISAEPKLDLELSKKDATEHSQSNSGDSVEEPERVESEDAEDTVSEKSEEENVSNPFDVPVSEDSASKNTNYDPSVGVKSPSLPSEKEKSLSQASEAVKSSESQVAQEEATSSEPKFQEELSSGGDKVPEDPHLLNILSSVSSPDESEEEKTPQSVEDNEASRSSRMESLHPAMSSESELEGENAGGENSAENTVENEPEAESESSVEPQSGDEVPQIIPERYEDEPIMNRSLLEAREQSGEAREQSGEAREQSGEAREQSGEAREQSGEASEQSGEASEPSQGHPSEGFQSSKHFEVSPVLYSESFRNEDAANRLRGVLLPLVDVFQVVIGCPAPCPYQRYFIQTDRVLKHVSKVEAKTIELLNIMKKAREITIKEVSDIFKFHQTAAKRRALLFVQKYIKSIKVLHFKVEAARKVVLIGLNTRILLQLLPSKYTREYKSEDLERISTQVDFALNEYNNIRKLLGSKTIKYGLMKFLSLSDFDRTIYSVKSNLEAELSGFVSKMPTFQKFVSRHKVLAFSLYDMMDKAGYPVKKSVFMIDRKGLTKEQLKLYKRKVNEDNKLVKSKLRKKDYIKFKRFNMNKWNEFSGKVYSG